MWKGGVGPQDEKERVRIIGGTRKRETSSGDPDYPVLVKGLRWDWESPNYLSRWNLTHFTKLFFQLPTVCNNESMVSVQSYMSMAPLYLTLHQLKKWWIFPELHRSHRLVWLLLRSGSLSNSSFHFKMAKDLSSDLKVCFTLSVKIGSLLCWGLWVLTWPSHRPKMCVLLSKRYALYLVAWHPEK